MKKFLYFIGCYGNIIVILCAILVCIAICQKSNDDVKVMDMIALIADILIVIPMFLYSFVENCYGFVRLFLKDKKEEEK